MALDVTLNNGAGTIYALKAQSYEFNMIRRPYIASPGGGNQPLLIDLGFFEVDLTMTVTLDESTPPADASGTVPTKSNLEDAARNWFNNTITLTASGESYEVKFKTFRAVLESAKEDRWTCTISLMGKGRS